MTERCQTKFREKIDNQNNIIYVGIVVGALGVLYFYRFHFATGLISYGLGCLACYYGLKSQILHNYVEQWKCHFVRNISKDELKDDPVKGCDTCGSKECNRHDTGLNPEPWVGLQIHKQLDLAIEDFYNAIIDQFINSWYSKVTLQPFFVDELKHQLRYASASLLRRALKVNFSRLILDRLVPCAIRHYTVCSNGFACAGSGGGMEGMELHPACASRAAELKYLRAVTDTIMPYLLRASEVNNPVFHVLIREIFSGWVLLSLTDVLSDPHILNTLIVLATGGETPAQLPTTPNYTVEFLETFARQTESVYASRVKLLRVDLELVMQDQEHFYAFMQHLKTTSHIHLLQFYKDISKYTSSST
ncbi:PXA domain-containing protein [Phthorimaea operculella]|nr:PXA domain-containing protein [Phthorimaea operculella]